MKCTFRTLVVTLSLLTLTFFIGCSTDTSLNSPTNTDSQNFQNEPGDSRCFWEREGVIELEGVDVSYKIQGRGIPCIVFASSKMYPRVLSWNLRRHFQFIFLDARWFGEVTDPENKLNFTMDDIANDIETVKNALGYDKVAVMGHSVHGVVVAEYAKRYPESVSHLIFLGSSPTGLINVLQEASGFWSENASSERQLQMAANMDSLANMDMSNMLPHEQFITQYVLEAPKYWDNYNYDCSWVWNGVTFDVEMVNYLYSLVYFFDLSGINAPIFAAHGTQDFSIPYTLWDQYGGVANDLTVELFTNSGHYPMVEEWWKFDCKLLNWIYNN